MSSELDDDFIQELKAAFCEEAKDNLDSCEAHILQFETSNSHEDLDAVKRELHCLKGSSNAAGLALFSKVVHSIEHYCSQSHEQSELVEFVLKSLDHLKEYLASIQDGDEQGADLGLQEKCGSLIAS